MAWVALFRHGITAWNELGKIQGRADTELSPKGIATLQRLRPHPDFLAARWLTSPLQRAVQTAAIVNPNARAQPCDALIEAHWGELEGIRRDAVRQRIAELGITPARGVDFAPPGGESARMVQTRILSWLTENYNGRENLVGVTHKGVIRSVLSLACDWDMTDDFSPEPDWKLPHIFGFENRKLRLVRLNCPWQQPPN